MTTAMIVQSVVAVLVVLLAFPATGAEICLFYNLDADCRYRVDGACLARILVNIDQCTDPIKVKFTITCQIPAVQFSHVFDTSDAIVEVPGFDRQVQLLVKLRSLADDEINVEADFIVDGQAKTDFMNDKVKLHGRDDQCPLLSQAAKIAIGVMGGLAAVAAALIVVLLMIRRQRQRAKAAQNLGTSHLVTNAEEAIPSSPPTASSVDPDINRPGDGNNTEVRFSELQRRQTDENSTGTEHPT